MEDNLKVKKKSKRTQYPHLLDHVYERVYEYVCPKRGLVRQIVQVKKYRSPFDIESIRMKKQLDDLLERIDEDQGISGVTLESDED